MGVKGLMPNEYGARRWAGGRGGGGGEDSEEK